MRVPRAAAVNADEDFDAWVAARSPALLRFAFLVTGSQDAADEAVQGALARAYERWSQVRRLDDRDAYLRRMVVNEHISWWRRFRRRETPVAEPIDRGRSRPDSLDGVAAADFLWDLCGSLPPVQRACVVLRYYEDLSYREIAAVIGSREVTARSHVHRALQSLRTAVEGDSDG